MIGSHWEFDDNTKLWRFPIIEGSIMKYEVSTLWSTYIGERRTTFAKAYGIKCEVLWGTILGTFQELGNSLLSHTHTPPPPPSKRKKREAPSFHMH
jgi:hypothetical protein